MQLVTYLLVLMFLLLTLAGAFALPFFLLFLQ